MEQSRAEAGRITGGINESLGTIDTEVLLRAYVPVNGMIQIVTPNQKRLSPVTSLSEKGLINREDVEYFNDERSEIIEFENKNYSFESIPIIMRDGQVANLQVITSIQHTVDDLSILRWVLFLATVIAMVPVLISSRLLSNLITKPITTLIETMTEIRKSGHFKRIELKQGSKDELYQMGETFNHMIVLLEDNFEKQDQFVANASHELRTPLTVIESYASLLKRRGLNEPKIFHESIEAIHSEAIRMKEMVEELLDLAKKQENWNIQFEAIDLNEHVRKTIKAFESAYTREIHFRQLNSEVKVVADDQKLKQLTYIILDNAKKYSEDGITVEVGRNGKTPFIRIIDRGLGIPKEDLQKVFDRFYRVDKARSRKMGGSGLGLSLASELASAMNAEIKLDSLEGVGTTVTIELSPA